MEGDILLSREELSSATAGIRVPQIEQYHTFNLVKAPRTITVRMVESMGPDFSAATDIAIVR